MGLGGAWIPSGHKLFSLVGALLLSSQSQACEVGILCMAGGGGCGGDFALTSSVTDLGLRRELKRTAVEQAEEALLQEAKDLAEVTVQGKG